MDDLQHYIRKELSSLLKKAGGENGDVERLKIRKSLGNQIQSDGRPRKIWESFVRQSHRGQLSERMEGKLKEAEWLKENSKINKKQFYNSLLKAQQGLNQIVRPQTATNNNHMRRSPVHKQHKHNRKCFDCFKDKAALQ